MNAVVRTANISTTKLVKELELDASDANFRRFQTFVEHKCLDALDSMYGQFSRFTGPILTQTTLSAISDEFKTTLPKQYHSISALLNRARYYNVTQFMHLQGQWDQEILYQFLTISCKRNPKLFTMWALINTASSYGGKNVDIQVFFGLAITMTAMLSKLNRCYPFDYIMQKTVATLQASGDFGVCVFDHSQMMKSLKFQRGEHSSNVSLVTSRLCLKPMMPNLISLLRWPSEKVPLTYSKQHIPSPPGMPMYESIQRITPSTFDGSIVCLTMMDITGDRVKAWALLTLLTSQIYKFQRLLKATDNEQFEFQFEQNIQAMRRLRINSKMQKN